MANANNVAAKYSTSGSSDLDVHDLADPQKAEDLQRESGYQE
jgi:hypothetical protein